MSSDVPVHRIRVPLPALLDLYARAMGYKPTDYGSWYDSRGHYSVTVQEAEILRSLARRHRLVIEIGTGLGISTLAMVPDGGAPHIVMTYDTDGTQDLRHRREVLQQFGVTCCISGFSAEHWSHLKHETSKLFFIDGDHSEPAVRHDFTQCASIARHGDVIAFHDCIEDAVNRVFEDVLRTNVGWKELDPPLPPTRCRLRAMTFHDPLRNGSGE